MSKKSFSATDVITTEFMNQFVQEVQIKGDLSSNVEPVGYKEIPSVKAVNDKFATILEANRITVKEATDVKTKINGKLTTDIFESNGTTVKEATDVKTKINGRLITDIFESNGTTVKKAAMATHSETATKATEAHSAFIATKAEMDDLNNVITSTYVKKSETIPASKILITNGSAFGNATTLQGVLDYIAGVFSGSRTVTKLCAKTFDAK